MTPRFAAESREKPKRFYEDETKDLPKSMTGAAGAALERSQCGL
jgi:hypothetical protein